MNGYRSGRPDLRGMTLSLETDFFLFANWI